MLNSYVQSECGIQWCDAFPASDTIRDCRGGVRDDIDGLKNPPDIEGGVEEDVFNRNGEGMMLQRQLNA